MKITAFLLASALVAWPAFAASGGDPVPAEEQKRQMADRLSSAISDGERLITRMSTESSESAKRAAGVLSAALESARSRWNELTAAASTDGEAARETAEDALASLQTAVYAASGFFTDERTTQNQRARQALADVERMVSDLRSRAAAATEDGKKALADAIPKLEDKRRSLAASIERLAGETGARWAGLRKDVEEELNRATDLYTDAVHRAAP